MKSLQGKMAPRKEKEGGGVMSIKLGGTKAKDASGGGVGGGGSGGAFKKGGFKNAFAPAGGHDEEGGERGEEDVKGEKEDVPMDEVDSDITDEEDYYDPRRPTGCMPDCGRSLAGKK